MALKYIIILLSLVSVLSLIVWVSIVPGVFQEIDHIRQEFDSEIKNFWVNFVVLR